MENYISVKKVTNLTLSAAQYKCTFQVESSILTSTKLPSKALITVQTIPEQNRTDTRMSHDILSLW
jgi:hypothetical protein